MRRRTYLLLVLLPVLGGCGFFSQGSERDPGTDVKQSVVLTSPAFPDGAGIPADFSCKGSNVSPPLQWSGVPDDARSLALVVVDPDASAGGFTHWVLYDIDPTAKQLASGVVPAGARQAKNSRGAAGWTGPCPPSGTHHYVFTLYVLRSPITLPDGSDTAPVLNALKGKAVAKGQLTGTFSAG